MKHLIPHFIQEQFQKGQRHGRFQGYTIFADLSGFTALTENLMARGAQGAEQLSASLNDIFEPLVHLVYARGGFIPYFAGDAFIAVFPSGHQAFTEIEAVHVAIQAREFFINPGVHFGEFPISIKIGIAFGEVKWGIVGKSRKAFYFRGRAVERCAEGQLVAGDLEIIADNALKTLLEHKGFSFREASEGFWKLMPIPAIGSRYSKSVVHTPEVDEDTAQQFLPKEVINLQNGGEFRTVISVFIGFTGVPDHEDLEQFSTIVLDQADNFSGYFKEIDFGDKGGVMVVLFGAPVSYENNLSRALGFFFALQTETQSLQASTSLRFKAGITIGMAFTGIVGGLERCQYAAVGKSVNLAVRLMSHADWGEALVDSEISKNRNYRFRHKGNIKYKGIKGDVPTFILEGRHIDQVQNYSGPIIGRDSEMKQLLDFAEPLFEQRAAGVALMVGEAGIGKTRITGELRRVLRESIHVAWYTCIPDQILRKPLNAFSFFLRNYFEQSYDGTAQQNRRNFEVTFELLLQSLAQKQPPGEAALRRELERLKSVLAGILGIQFPGSLWEQLDAKGKYDNTKQAIIHLLTVEAAIQPLVLEIEDAQWLDEDTSSLLRDITLRLPVLPILILINARPSEEGKIPQVLPLETVVDLHLPVLEIHVGPLTEKDVALFAEMHLNGKIAPEFLKELAAQTNNNPFYVEQVLAYCLERKLIIQKDGRWQLSQGKINISGSVQSILTARIDRLSSMARETVKAAAVIGREFEVPILNEVMSYQEAFSNSNGNTDRLVHEQIKTAEQGQIWHALTEMRYIFRHSLLCEAAYHMQMRSRLNELHALIARAIEHLYAHNLPEHYAELAHHYEQAGIVEKTREYQIKAADYAKQNYQNLLAISYYEKVVPLLRTKPDSSLLFEVLLSQGQVLDLVSRWEDCRQSFSRALEIAQKSKEDLQIARALYYLGRVRTFQGEYQDAQGILQRASEIFKRFNNARGMAQTFGSLGVLFFRKGNYPDAKTYFAQSIALANDNNPAFVDAQIVATYALAYMNQGDYDSALKIIEAQIPSARQLGDKPGLASLITYKGIILLEKGAIDEAFVSYSEGLSMSEMLGDTMLKAVNKGGIGSIYERRGDYEKAMHYFMEDLHIVEMIGDKQGMAIALQLIGELLSFMGIFGKAIDYLQKSLMYCEELGYRKGIAKVVNTLGDIYFFTNQFSRAIEFYDKAIEVTRQIDAKLILGNSLMEKGQVLAAMDCKDELHDVATEALNLARSLGNAQLEFEARILYARWIYMDGNQDEAIAELEKLRPLTGSDINFAALTFRLWELNPQDTELRIKALELYKNLYNQTPKYLFQARISTLES